MYKDNGYNNYRYNRDFQAESPYEEVHTDGSADSSSARASYRKIRHEHRKMGAFMKSLCCALIIGGVSGGMILGSFAAGSQFGQAKNSTISTTTSSALSTASTSGSSSKTSSGYTVAQIAEKCTPSVVAITNKSVSDTMNLFGQSYQNESESAGSGVIISKNDSEVIIVTNYHVIEDSQTLTVCFNDSKDAVYEASVKGTDEENDLAVIAVSAKDIDEDVADSITVATIGDSKEATVGEQVVAIGNALGYGQSVTSGYISALDKEVAVDNDTTATLIQTDAAINPGNSGGALFNMNGELIGINSAKYADTTVEGMGFAIPTATAKSIIEDLMTGTSRSRLTSGYGSLGIYGQDVSDTDAKAYDMPTGVYVSQITDDSAAGKAGLQKGDIITKLDGKKVSSMSSLKNMLQYYKAGEKVSVTYSRSDNGSYKENTVTVTLGTASDSSSNAQSGNSQNAENGMQGYGGRGSMGSYGDSDEIQGFDGQGGDSIEDIFGAFGY